MSETTGLAPAAPAPDSTAAVPAPTPVAAGNPAPSGLAAVESTVKADWTAAEADVKADVAAVEAPGFWVAARPWLVGLGLVAVALFLISRCA